MAAEQSPTQIADAPREIIVVADWESTGQYYMFGADLPFCYGLACCAWNEERRAVEVLDKRLAVVDLGKPEGQTWENYWKMNGLEERAWNGLWKSNQHILDSLMKRAKMAAVPITDIAAQFHRDKKNIEEKFASDSIRWATDGLLYDPTIGNFMLQKEARPSLMFYDTPDPLVPREARYNFTDPVELYSFIYGRLAVGLAADWKKDVEPVLELLREIAATYAPHDHSPENDAVNIACMIIYANLPRGCDLDVLAERLAERKSQIADTV